jgi:DHA2 family multidrug resistance protein
MALLPPLMQGLMGYPVLTAGLINMPRGVGLFASVIVVGQLVGRVDTRLILLIGLTFCSVATWQMMHFDLMMTDRPFMISGTIQGFGIGLIFVPLSTLAFATIAPSLRGEASALYNLIRNTGSAVGISIMQAIFVSNIQTMHASLAANIDPSNPVVTSALAGRYDLSTATGLQALNGEITRQATMVAYINDFKLMFIISLVCMPMLLLMRRPKQAPSGPAMAHVD